MGEPMVTDSGCASLEQSQHYPLAGRSQYSYTLTKSSGEEPANSRNSDDDETEMIERRIKACVILGKEEEVSRLLRDLIAATATATAKTTTPPRTPRTPLDDDPVTIGQLRTMLKEAF
jgi:hypothetical protein